MPHALGACWRVGMAYDARRPTRADIVVSMAVGVIIDGVMMGVE